MPRAEQKTRVKTGASAVEMVSPLNGARSPTGAHPKNTGGKVGRSGRKTGALKAELERIRDTKAVPYVETVIDGVVTYRLNAICSKCGEPSTGPETLGDVLKIVPPVSERRLASDLTMKYTWGTERTIRLEGGVEGTQAAFDVIRARIRAGLPSEIAEPLIADIVLHLKSL